MLRGPPPPISPAQFTIFLIASMLYSVRCHQKLIVFNSQHTLHRRLMVTSLTSSPLGRNWCTGRSDTCALSVSGEPPCYRLTSDFDPPLLIICNARSLTEVA